MLKVRLSKLLLGIAVFLVLLIIFDLYNFKRTVNYSESTGMTLFGVAQAVSGDYNNAILLQKDKVVRFFDNTHTSCDYTSLKKILQNQQANSKQSTLHIIVEKDTDYQSIVAVLKMMPELHIESYKLFKA